MVTLVKDVTLLIGVSYNPELGVNNLGLDLAKESQLGHQDQSGQDGLPKICILEISKLHESIS